MLERMYSLNGLLEKGLQASVIRNDVIQDNISNADTPGYKKRTVAFEENLAQEVKRARKGNKIIDLTKITPTISTSYTRYRLDGNNVDINEEMVELYKNTVRYDMLISSVSNNIKRLNLVLNK